MKTYNGQLQVDEVRGVIWFNDDTGVCRVRISKINQKLLTKPMIDLVADSTPIPKKQILYWCSGCDQEKPAEEFYAVAKELNNPGSGLCSICEKKRNPHWIEGQETAHIITITGKEK